MRVVTRAEVSRPSLHFDHPSQVGRVLMLMHSDGMLDPADGAAAEIAELRHVPRGAETIRYRHSQLQLLRTPRHYVSGAMPVAGQDRHCVVQGLGCIERMPLAFRWTLYLVCK
jgi:hypothetical protein